MALPNGVTVGTISSGTLQPHDTIPKFLDLLRKLNPDAAAKIEMENREILDSYEWQDAYEAMTSMLEQIWDAIDENMPNGFYFGPVDGDGADFGVWEMPVT